MTHYVGIEEVLQVETHMFDVCIRINLPAEGDKLQYLSKDYHSSEDLFGDSLFEYWGTKGYGNRTEVKYFTICARSREAALKIAEGYVEILKERLRVIYQENANTNPNEFTQEEIEKAIQYLRHLRSKK